MDCTLVKCPNCSTTNRIKSSHPGLAPVCGNCRKRLPVELSEAKAFALMSRPSGQFEKINGIFAVTFVCFVMGIFSPLMTVSKHVTKWYITLVDEKNTVSLVSGLQGLVHDGHWGIFLLLFAFSIVFPVTKLVLCLLMWSVPMGASTRHSISNVLYHAGKWSMLDVFVVGILVVAVKLGDTVEVQLHSGVFWFAASVCLSIWLKTCLSKVENSER